MLTKALVRAAALLGLNGTGVGDAGMAAVAGRAKLTRLTLGGTRVTDAGLAVLERMPGLEMLVLDGTSVTAAGVGPSPVPRKRLTEQNLGDALRVATTDSAMGRRAAELGSRIRAENGVLKPSSTSNTT